MLSRCTVWLYGVLTSVQGLSPLVTVIVVKQLVNIFNHFVIVNSAVVVLVSQFHSVLSSTVTDMSVSVPALISVFMESM